MRPILKNTFRNPRNLLILFAIVIILTLVSVKFFVPRVTANVIPVKVYEVNIAFGTVFPGEELQKNFTVYYVEEYQQGGVTYSIIKRIKPKWPEPSSCQQGFTTIEEARAYCIANPSNTNCCYPNLCPFLTPIKIVEEGEAESAASSYVGPEDLSDAWIIYFKVPAIIGNVSQDNSGGVVSSSGDYGCDIAIDVLE